MNTTRILRNTIGAALLAGALSTSASTAQAQLNVFVGMAPPAIPIYTQPLCPGDDYIWTPGYWAYGDDRYSWVLGVWVSAPYAGALWIPGYWAYSSLGYFWNPGFWGASVGPDEANRNAGASSGRPNYSDIHIDSTGIHNNINAPAPRRSNYGDIHTDSTGARNNIINSTGVHNNISNAPAPRTDYSNTMINSSGVHNDVGGGRR